MIRNSRNLVRSGESRNRGAATVEMAIVTPVLIFLFGGIISFGLLFFLHGNMLNAARDAARRLAVGEVTVGGNANCAGPQAGSAEELACGQLSSWASLDFTLAVCSPDFPGPNCVADSNDVAVEITIPLSDAVLMDVLGLFGSGNITARVIMRDES